MTATYRIFNWEFDAKKWAEALNAIDPETRSVAREMSGLTAAGWRHWMKGETANVYKQPGMLNFINVCNFLDLDPRDFFALKEW